MTWNYRIVREKLKDGSYWYGIHEVYYSEGVLSCTVSPDAAVGESVEEIKQALEWMQLALDKPVLELVGDDYVELEPQKYEHIDKHM